MKELFIDTSFLLSLANKDDKYHKEGKHLFKQLKKNTNQRYIISDYVIDEFLTLISRMVNMKLANIWGEYLFQEKWFDICYTSSRIVHDAWSVFKKEIDERSPLSFTDCIIVAFCSSRKINNIITFDDRLKNYLD
jgi:predicted nucleic acid-binding protein